MLDIRIKTLLKQYADNQAFRKTQQHLITNPWHRPLGFSHESYENAKAIDSIDEVHSNNSYMLNKVLFNIYEQQTPFLHDSKFTPSDKQDFDSFYDPNSRAIGQALQTPLENAIFGFLFESFEKKNWTRESLLQHMTDTMAYEDVCPLGLAKVMDDINHKELGVQMFLLHKASDFLTEGSAMPKVLAGNTGQLQMSLTRVFMDEYGSGDISRKHSTLFKKAMRSVGLSGSPHSHFEDYLPASIMMTNFFHFVCGNPQHFFRYLGAIYFAEASTVEFFRKLTNTFKAYDPDGNINLEYFDEHIEVDQTHRQICWQELIIAALDIYGDTILNELYEGFEAFGKLAMVASGAVSEQIYFADAVLNNKYTNNALTSSTTKQVFKADNHDYMAQIAQQTRHWQVISGSMEVGIGSAKNIILKPGESIIIPKERMYRMRAIEGNDCHVIFSDL